MEEQFIKITLLDLIKNQKTIESYTKPMAKAWREKYDRSEVKRAMIVCFWRPILMKEPVRANPLGLCDRKSVNVDDQVLKHLYGFAQKNNPIYNLALKHSPDHKWFYYPNMTNDETIAFV